MYREWDKELGMWLEEPGTRDSDYFATREEAEAELKRIVETGDISTLREHP